MPRNSRSGGRKRIEAASTLAVRALSFLAEDPLLISRFLATSGIAPDTLRSAAAQPDFLTGVMNFIAEDEGLIIAFAEYAGISPAEVDRARQALAGADWERDVP